MKRKLNTIIIPYILGGLGNQLFAYAAARRLALVSNSELLLDHIGGFKRDYAYNRTYQLDHFNIPCRKATPTQRLEPFSYARRQLKRRLSQLQPFENRRYIRQEGNDFDARLLHLKPKGTLHLEGYWQSEAYFKDVESIIRRDLKIIPPDDAQNLAMAKRIKKSTSVCVHLRFFDNILEESIHNAPGDYYADAIAQMGAKVPDAHYYVFSDQPENARARINLPEKSFTIVSHNHGDENAYADLWLMTKCKHFIIANSTFSWWGAWLGDYEGKHVIAPGFRITEENRVTSWGFRGLLPESWLSI